MKEKKKKRCVMYVIELAALNVALTSLRSLNFILFFNVPSVCAPSRFDSLNFVRCYARVVCA